VIDLFDWAIGKRVTRFRVPDDGWWVHIKYYLLAGTLSTNPLLFILGTWLVLAWRVGGWWGLDRWLLPLLGTPWAPGALKEKVSSSDEATGEMPHGAASA
jgi:hypothetical protein